MEEGFPEEIRKARALLKEFEQSDNHLKRIRRFENAINILNDYLEDFPQSSHEQYVMNIKLSYTRFLINHLNKINPPNMEEWIEYSLLLLVKMKKEVKEILEINPGLKDNYDNFLKLWEYEAEEELKELRQWASSIKIQTE